MERNTIVSIAEEFIIKAYPRWYSPTCLSNGKGFVEINSSHEMQHTSCKQQRLMSAFVSQRMIVEDFWGVVKLINYDKAHYF